MSEEVILDGGFRVATGLLPNQESDNLLCANLEDFPDDWIWDGEDIQRHMVLGGTDRYKLDRARRAFRMRNQGGLGKCNASSNASGMEQVREQQGFKHVELNDCFTYMQVNGGADQGSTLPSTFDNLQKVGVAPYRLQVGGMTKTFPNDVFKRSQVNAELYNQAQVEASRFKGVRFLKLPLGDFRKFCLAAATCIARGLPIVWAWHVGNNGSRLNSGYMQCSNGPGNHSNLIHSGKWVGGSELVHPDNQNSWGPTKDTIYGPSGPSWGEGGFGLATMEDLYSCVQYHPPYTMVSSGIDPTDPIFDV